MLIIFSGIVGSGKSTNAKQAYRLLQELGYPAVYFRFRFFTWRKIFQPLPDKKKTPLAATSKKRSTAGKDDEPLRQQPTVPLTLLRSLGYLGRMIILRIFLALRLRQKIVIMDRFFYDSFVHYALNGRRERFYLSIIKRMMPVPDLALMLTAEPQTILQRRPHYDTEYVHRLSRSYGTLVQEFPNLVAIKTDNLDHLSKTIAQLMREAAAATGPDCTRSDLDNVKLTISAH